MRDVWKQAGLILLHTIVIWGAMLGSLRLLNGYPQSLMFYPGDFEGQIDLAIVTLVAYLAVVTWIERRAGGTPSARCAGRLRRRRSDGYCPYVARHRHSLGSFVSLGIWQ